MGEGGEIPRGDARAIALRVAGAAALLLGAVFALSRLAGPRVEPLAAAFVARFGYLGMGVGAFVTDFTTFPVPPQFYMLTAVSSGAAWAPSLACIIAGSLLGGGCGVLFGGRIATLPAVQRRMARTRPWIDALHARYGAKAMVVAAFSPIPFSLLCYALGVYRLGARSALIVLGLRGPRLALFYALIALGWGR